MEEFNKADFLITFGNRIKEIRIEKGMSQDELATRAGYTSRSTISKIENGKADVPRSQIVKLANALGVDPTELTYTAIVEIKTPSEYDLELARRISRLDSYRKALIESIINTEPKQ